MFVVIDIKQITIVIRYIHEKQEDKNGFKRKSYRLEKQTKRQAYANNYCYINCNNSFACNGNL